MKLIVRFIPILCTLAYSCKQPNQEQLNELVKRGEFKQSELVDHLEKDLKKSAIREQYRFGDTLYHFYKKHKFKPIWALYMVNDSMAEPVLNRMYQSRYEGLDPRYYKLDTIKNLLKELRVGDIESLYDELVHLELLVSDNLLSFHQDRVIGRTNPDSVFKGIYQLPKRKYDDFDLLSVLNYKRYNNVLSENEHKDTAYVFMKDLLKSVLQRHDSRMVYTTIDTTGVKKLEPGDTTDLMPSIARKMYELGVITEQEMLLADSQYYTKKFIPLVERFQEQFGLLKDGIFGRTTFGFLNQTVEDQMDEFAANMERLRWFMLPDAKEDPYVSVNLPAYELTLHYDDSLKYMATCIGKARPYDYDERVGKAKKEGKYWLRPADHETPQIYSKIAYMVVNPTWNVPNSIISREMWWKMRTDSHYLAKAGYGVFYKKQEIRSDTINWKLFTPKKLPFEIIQKSGDANALGRIKFIFPNKFSIYLHDTPQKKKFEQTARAVSHGCVRVANPILLGEFITQNIDTLDSDDFRIHMGLEPIDEERLEEYDPEDTLARIQPIEETKLIRLNKQMPVYFLYRTIYFDKEWTPHYRFDVYDKNKYIIKAMNF